MSDFRKTLYAFCFVFFCSFSLSASQSTDTSRVAFPSAPRGILLGSDWNPEKRELNDVFANQNNLDLGMQGVRTIHIWTEIINSTGTEITWIVEYENGLTQEVWTQKIRYDRFRTYLKKIFRRKLWDARQKKLVDVSGPCVVKIVDKKNNGKILAEKYFILK